MILINTLAIVGCVVAGTQVYDKVMAGKASQPRVTFMEKLAPQASGRRWREEKEKRVGAWFSVPAMLRVGKDERRQNLEVLSAEQNTPQISDAEQRINHYFAVSLASLGIAVAGSLFFPPLRFLSLPTLIYSAFPIYQNAYRAIVKEKRVSVDIVYASVVTIIVVGQNFVLANTNIAFFFLSEKLLVMARNRFKKNLRQMFGELPTTVRVVDASGEVEVEKRLERVQVGDIIVLQAGETIPIDGMITHGCASIDQHVLTGESQPVEKEKTERVFASTVVLSGRIYVQVEEAAEQTMVAKIGDILERTTEFKSSQRFWAEMTTDKTVVPIFALAGLSVPFIGTYGAGAIMSAHPQRRIITSTPLSVLNFLNLASQQGILVKDGRILELFSQVDTVVFDKTGTLTLAQPTVAQVHPTGGHSEQSLLTLAAAAESKQSHPIAKAIRQAAEASNCIIPEIDEAEYQIGYGLTVRIGEQLVQVGSLRFIEKEGIQIPPPLGTRIDEIQQQGETVVLVAVEGRLAGAIELHATIRPEAQKVIQRLQQHNLSLVIISGDHEQPTKKLAQTLGIEHYFAETLPEQKADLIAQLQEAGKFVCFVGDGINDTIALKKAHVSISLRGAATAATDTAHVVLMNSELNQLVDFWDLVQKFKINMRNTMMTILVPSVLCIGGAFFLHFGIVHVELIDYVAYLISAGIAMSPAFTPARNQPESSKFAR